MEAVAQVTAGAGTQGAGRALSRTGEAGADFGEQLRTSVALGQVTHLATAHGQSGKASNAKAEPEKKMASMKKPDQDGAKAESPSVKANASDNLPALSDAVAQVPGRLAQVPQAMAGGVESRNAIGLTKAVGVQHGKVPLVGAKKEAVAGPSMKIEAGEAGQKTVSEVPGESRGMPSAAMGKEAVGLVVIPLATGLRLPPTDGTRGSLKTLAESATAVHVGAAPTEAVHTIQAAANVLEVGLSTAHGWLQVRAQLSGAGEVTAQVLTASASAAENLHKELPQLSAYLASEQIGVSSLTVNAMDKGGGAQDAAMAFGAGGGSGTEREAQRQTSGGGAFNLDEMQMTLDFTGMAFLTGSSMSGGGGGWLSVRV